MDDQRQPDFNAVADGFVRIGEQMRLCQNLPAVDGAAGLTERFDRLEHLVIGLHQENRAQIEGISAEMTAMNTRLGVMDTRLGVMDTRLDALTTRMEVTGANQLARTANNMANHSSSVLQPLRAVATGDPIPHFPARVGDIDTLTGRRANDILESLALPTGGSADDKKRRIRVAVGVQAVVP